MNFAVVGTNHKFSPIWLREELSFSKAQSMQGLMSIRESPAISGAVILSTCNRVELYVNMDDTGFGKEELLDTLFINRLIKKEKYLRYLYFYKGEDAIRHLFSVACGLDSLVLGEAQIAGQVKAAFTEAKTMGYTDEYMDTLFTSAVAFAKKMHRETAISEGKVSIGSVAIDFIKRKSGGFSGKNILMIGAGKVTELVLRYLHDEKPSVIFISSRTFDKAKELASRIGQSAVRLDKLKYLIRKADIIISATRSPHFIIKKETIDNNISRRLIIMDLAMPRDIDPKVGKLSNVELFNLEDLDSVIQANLKGKRSEAEKIKNIISKEVYLLWQPSIALEPEPALLP